MADQSAGPPPTTCEGFYKTDRPAQEAGSSRVGKALGCTQGVGGNTFGWCSCSDGVPRMVNPGSAKTTCKYVCAHTPSTYTSSDIPALTGTPESKSLSKFESYRLEKLAGALAAFLIGCALMVFHVAESKGTQVGGAKALAQLVKATGIAPDASPPSQKNSVRE